MPAAARRRWPAPATEFWQEATAALPDFVWLAEVYWDMEWRMQELGFKFTYDKRLYDRLHEGSAGHVRDHLHADLLYQSKMARFLENHDEPRCAAVETREEPLSASLGEMLRECDDHEHVRLRVPTFAYTIERCE